MKESFMVLFRVLGNAVLAFATLSIVAPSNRSPVFAADLRSWKGGNKPDLLYTVRYSFISGVPLVRWTSLGANKLRCEGNPYCIGPNGIIVPPDGYRYCKSDLIGLHGAGGIKFSGKVEDDGTLTFSSESTRNNAGLIVDIKMIFIDRFYSCKLSYWFCGPGTVAGDRGCVFVYDPPGGK